MTDEKKLNISFLIKEVLIKDVMAYTLDMARMSSMGDRQFDQFSRSIKKYMYDVVRGTNDYLVTYKSFITADTNDILPKLDSKNDGTIQDSSSNR